MNTNILPLDYFAAFALHGLLTRNAFPISPTSIAAEAWRLADAMLKQRNKRQELSDKKETPT